MTYIKEGYASINEAPVYGSVKSNGKPGKLKNKILIGNWVGATEKKGDWYKVVTLGEDGWLHKDHIKDTMGLRVYYVDVGQGDGALIEMGDIKIIIDGGRFSNFKKFLNWKYQYVFDKRKKVHIDYLIVSHFDDDHFAGLTSIINDKNYTFGEVIHNGIARFYTDKELSENPNKKRPAEYNEDLGTVEEVNGVDHLKTTFSSLDDIAALQKLGGFKYNFGRFWKAAEKAHTDGRLNAARVLLEGDQINLGNAAGADAKMECLGPVPTKVDTETYFKWFTDSSHTRNGHSVVIKLHFGHRTLLFGGDLNSESEQHLMDHFEKSNPFEVDVTKQCHHGSADFKVEFMKKINPYATVISSGDNESHAHPRADAVGCAGKYSRGLRPKVFSTELARSVSDSDTLYGLINLRSDGDKIYMAQMKESRKGADPWDSYEII